MTSGVFEPFVEGNCLLFKFASNLDGVSVIMLPDLEGGGNDRFRVLEVRTGAILTSGIAYISATPLAVFAVAKTGSASLGGSSVFTGNGYSTGLSDLLLGDFGCGWV